MYNIPYFKDKNPEAVLDFMRKYPFAMLIGCAGNMPVATQIPFLFEEEAGRLFLVGHFMRNTDHHKAFEQNSNALCVFTGAQSYVSASWYTQPQNASTWNYMSVHAKGILRFTDEDELVEILHRTTKHFENNDASPASFHHLPQDYVRQHVKAIIGFRIEVQEIEHVFKLSQNRDEESYTNIMHQLNSGDADAKNIAAEMEKRQSQIFK